MKKILISILIVSSLFSLNAQNALDNFKVIEMKKAKLSKVIILNSVEEAKDFNYDTSTNGLKELSDNKVEDEIIILMMKKQKEKIENNVDLGGIKIDKNEYGLFVNDNNKKVKIASHLTQVDFKTTGLVGSILKAIIPNPNADIKIEKNITIFYFNMNVDETASTNTTYNLTNSISDPNEGELVILSKKGNNREIQIGRFGGMRGMKVEIPEKFRVEYKVEKIKNNLYKIALNSPLESGEYGFIFGAINPGATMKIYDFTIK